MQVRGPKVSNKLGIEYRLDPIPRDTRHPNRLSDRVQSERRSHSDHDSIGDWFVGLLSVATLRSESLSAPGHLFDSRSCLIALLSNAN